MNVIIVHNLQIEGGESKAGESEMEAASSSGGFKQAGSIVRLKFINFMQVSRYSCTSIFLHTYVEWEGSRRKETVSWSFVYIKWRQGGRKFEVVKVGLVWPGRL